MDLNSFGDTGRALMLQLQHAFAQHQNLRDRIVVNSSTGHDSFLGLLLSSYFLGPDWKHHAVGLAEEVLSNYSQFDGSTLYLFMLARQRRRDVVRRIPNPTIDSICEEILPTDPRTNALYGEYLRSNAQDRIMEGSGDLKGALSELRKFRYFYATPTAMERVEKEHHFFLEGKICRWKGLFSEACDIFFQLLKSRPSLSNEMGCNLTGHYVAVLCEQHHLDYAETIARQAVSNCKAIDEKV